MESRPERISSTGFLAHRGLITVASLAAMAEAGLLISLAPAARSVAPQITALPPLAIYHDLRWIYASQRSWLGFALLLVGVVVARSSLNAALVRLAWPAGTPAPSPLATLRASAAFTLVACVLISPVASLSFGLAILPFSWPFFGMLPALLVIALPLSHGGVADGWWRFLPPPAAAGWLLADFAFLSMAAAAIGRLPAAATVPLAGLAGLANAWAWHGMTAAVVHARERSVAHAQARARRHSGWPALRIPATPLALAVSVVVLVAAVRGAFLIAMPDAGARAPSPLAAVPGQSFPAPAGPASAASRSGQPPVLVIPGFGSSCCAYNTALARMMPATLVQQFSYRGLSASGRPLPYGLAATNLPLTTLGDRIASQVRHLHAETGQPVDIVAESEGTLGVYAMLAEHPQVPVGSVALLSPIVAPGRVSYHPGTGRGMVAGGELQAVVWFVGGLSPFGTSGAQDLIDSVNSVGARYAQAAAQNPSVRWLTIIPLADAFTLPACGLPPGVLVMPAFHGELLGDAAALSVVRDFLLRQPVPGTAGMRSAAEVAAAAGSAWRMPEATPPALACAG